jgi:hypothetical protein
MLPMQALAELDRGSCFGGSGTLLGEGPYQSALRVVVTSATAELYHMHVDAFLMYGGSQLVR